MGKILKLVALGVRLGAAGGSVYLLQQEGVWGNTQQGVQAYERLKSLKLAELVGPEIAAQVPDLSPPEEVTSALNSASSALSNLTKNQGSNWNYGVAKAFDGLEALPHTVSTYTSQAIAEIKEKAN